MKSLTKFIAQIQRNNESRKSIKIAYKFISPLLNIAKHVKLQSMTNANWCKIYHCTIFFVKIIEKSSLSQIDIVIKDISLAPIRDAIDESRKLNFSLFLNSIRAFLILNAIYYLDLCWQLLHSLVQVPIYANLWSRKFNLRGFFALSFSWF